MTWDLCLDFAPGCGMDEESRLRFEEGVRKFDFDRGLAPSSDDEGWRDMTAFVDEHVLVSAGLSFDRHGMTEHLIPGDPDEESKRDDRWAQVEEVKGKRMGGMGGVVL